MNAITHPVINTHHLFAVAVKGAVSVALTVGVLAPFTTTATAVPLRHPTNTGSALCALLAGATPGSPAAFRIAETIADQGLSCDPPFCALLAGATPGSPAAFRIAETIADLGERC